MVLLDEVGGRPLRRIGDHFLGARITKPLVSWVMGTCASIFPNEVQFGHAGAMARGDLETAVAKNTATRGGCPRASQLRRHRREYLRVTRVAGGERHHRVQTRPFHAQEFWTVRILWPMPMISWFFLRIDCTNELAS